MKILLVEDDEALIALLMRCFRDSHYIVDVVRDGEAGWNYGCTFEYDLIMLDIMLPQLDGITLCQRLRSLGNTTPILLLTAQDTSTAKVQGLEAGADDYVVKPFDRAELLARIRALVRRSSVNPLPVIQWHDLLLNPSTCEVSYCDRPLSLTTKEYDLLELLLRNRDHVFSSDEILDRLWASEEFPAEATVRSHIRRLRHKLQGVGAPSDLICTLHGRGYYLKSPMLPGSSDAAIAPSSPDPSVQLPERSAIADVDPTAASDLHDQYVAFLNETWKTTQPKCLDHLCRLKETIAQIPICHAIDPNEIDPLQDQAYHIAHQLVGTISVFGLAAATQLARQVERIVQPATRLQEDDIRIIIPLLDALYQEIQSASIINLSTEPSQRPTSTTTSIRLMLVDDDPDWLQMVPTLLQPWDFQITTLADPQQFWPVLQTVQPDVLVLDVNMPPFNGFDLCQVLRSHPHWHRLPVVFVSGLGDPETQNDAFMVGADDYLCKPIRGSDLATRIFNRLQRVRSWSMPPSA